MMDARIRLLGLLAACLAAAVALAGVLVPDASASGRRTLAAVLSPSPGDVSLLRVRFPHAGPGELLPGALRVTVRGAFGEDYLALATPRRRRRGGLEAYLLVANRPSALMDPATVHLRLSARGSLGAPLVSHLNDLLGHAHVQPPSGFCSLTPGGTALAAPSLRVLAARGATVRGFGAGAAVAVAYDAACGLPHSEAFKQALAGETASEGGCATTPCEPAPAPPVPAPPHCAPCNPAPGYACPLSASTAVCVASRDETAPAAAPAAH
jgi:hypothetical protein